MANLALDRRVNGDVASLLRLTQRQLRRNWLLDNACRGLWWPAGLLAIAGIATLAGVRAPWHWLAAAGILVWITATALYAKKSRSNIADAAQWLDRVSDSRELFVTAADLLGGSSAKTPAGLFVLARAQRRLPTARVRSAATIGWKIPKHTGFAVLLSLGGLAALARPANEENRYVNTSITTGDASHGAQHQPESPLEGTAEFQPALAQKLAQALRQTDTPLSSGNEKSADGSAAAVPSLPEGLPDAASKMLANNERHNAPRATKTTAKANPSSQNASQESSKNGQMAANGKTAGDNQADSSNVGLKQDSKTPTTRTEYVDLTLKSQLATTAQERAGPALLRGANQRHTSAAVYAAAAGPRGVPIPAHFGPTETQLVTQYFFELNADK